MLLHDPAGASWVAHAPVKALQLQTTTKVHLAFLRSLSMLPAYSMRTPPLHVAVMLSHDDSPGAVA
jgi:hypothetical protein